MSTAGWEAVVVGVVGAVIGALLAVPAARVPERRPVGRRPFPEVRSALRTPTGIVTVATTAGLFAALAVRFRGQGVGVAYLVLAAALVVLSVIDARRFVLPDRIVLPLAGFSVVALGASAWVDGRVGGLGRAVVGGLAACAGFALLHLVAPRSLGLGDVKLAFVLGLFLGYLGWDEVVLGLFLGFLAGAVVGGGLIVLRRRSPRDPIPFGPFLAAGTLTCVLVGSALLDWYRG